MEGQTTSDHPAIGALLAKAGSDEDVVCTGALIHARLVLTAAHCVEAVQAFADANYSLRFALGDDVRTASGIDASAGLDGWEAHPDYDALLLTDDVGVVVLSSPLSPTPLALSAQTPDTSWSGDELTFVGFGITEPQGADAGIKRTVDLPIYYVTDWWIEVYDDGGGNICSGDSGGPALLPGGDVVGVNSFVWWAKDEEACVEGGGAIARIDMHLDWLQAHIDAAEALPDPDTGPADTGEEDGGSGGSGSQDVPEGQSGSAFWGPEEEAGACAGAALAPWWLLPIFGWRRR